MIINFERLFYNKKEPGSCLLSRLEAVSSAQGSLTSVFGMGTGISSPPWPPGNNCRKKRKRKKGQASENILRFQSPAVVSHELFCIVFRAIARER